MRTTLTSCAAIVLGLLMGSGAAYVEATSNVRAVSAGANTPANATLAGTASVINGDTIEIRGQRIRLEGIDAPDGRQLCLRDGRNERCGQVAALFLADRIGRQPVSCTDEGRDRYDRVLSICYQNGQDLNGLMVSEGYAVAYRQYSRRYVGEEEIARNANRGVWGTQFEMPWDWRRSH